MTTERKEQFTPGPWESSQEISDNDNYHSGIYEAGWKGLGVARCNQNGNHEADANLIATAPELYEALENLTSMLQVDDLHHESIDRADAILSKARGEMTAKGFRALRISKGLTQEEAAEQERLEEEREQANG